MRRLLSIMGMVCLLTSMASARQRLSGWCEQGNKTVTIGGMTSNFTYQQSYPNCTVTVYLSNTLTLATIYSDNNGTSLSNPFTADATGYWRFYADNGRFDVKFSGGDIASPFALGDFLLNDPSSTGTLENHTIDTADGNVIKINGNTLAASAGTATITFPNITDTLVNLTSVQTLLNKTLTSPSITSPTITSPVITSGATIAGGETVDIVNGAVLYADQYASVQAAIDACPANGCIIYATAPTVNLALGALDPGTKNVILYLGPYHFTATQITLRGGLQLLGAGSVDKTRITSVGTNSQPLLVIPQSNDEVINPVIQNIEFDALSGNTSQVGLYSDVSTLTNAAFEYFQLQNLFFINFSGPCIWLKGRPSDAASANQQGSFTNIHCRGNTNTSYVLKIEGYAGQLAFYDSEFNGDASTTVANMYVGTTGNFGMGTIYFHNITNQGGNNVGVEVHGAGTLVFDGMHFEDVPRAFNITNSPGLGSASNWNIVIENSYFDGNTGVDSGSGYLLNVDDGFATVSFHDNTIVAAPPDAVITGISHPTVNAYNNRQTVIFNGVFPTSGMTLDIAPAATIGIHGATTVDLSASATSITTVNSYLLPGERVTFYANGGGSSQFATGGNLDLGGNVSPLVLQGGDSATFVRVDAGTPKYRLVSVSREALTGSASLNFAAWAGADCQDLTLTVTGAIDGNAVYLGVPNALASVPGVQFNAFVSAANTVTVRGCKVTAGASSDPAAVTVTAKVVQR